MNERVQAWRDAVAASGHRLRPDEAQRLLTYVEALCAAGRAPNLTALDSVARIDEVLVRPSLLVAYAVQEAPQRVADVGSGNGFPGIVAKALWPQARVCLVERRRKKARAVANLARDAGLDVTVLACDAREMPREGPAWIGACDLVTARAVGPLADTTRMAAPLLARGGRLVHWKTDDLRASEREQGLRGAHAEGLRALDDIRKPEVADARLVRFERGPA